MEGVTHITVDDGERLKLLKLIEKKNVCLFFLDLLKRLNILNLELLINVKVFLNSIAYPYNNLNLDFAKNNFTLLYDMYTSFQEYYYEKSVRNLIFNPTTFLSNASIIVIDTSKQNDSATDSSVNVQLEIKVAESLSGVIAYCLLIHRRIVECILFTREARILVQIVCYNKKKNNASCFVGNDDIIIAYT